MFDQLMSKNNTVDIKKTYQKYQGILSLGEGDEHAAVDEVQAATAPETVTR